MKINDLSVTIYTRKIEESKKFYGGILGGKITFDCGWYATVTFNNGMSVSFMNPQQEGRNVESGEVMISFKVDDVDAEYAELKGKADIVVDIANQPWGDRSFRISDPLGNVVYIYTPAPVSDEYKDAVNHSDETEVPKQKGPHELWTERLRLRPLHDADYDLFFTMSEKPLVSEYLPPFPDRESSDFFLDYLREAFDARGWGFWAIENRKDRRFMGIVGLNEPGPEYGVRPCIEIGWRLDPEFWGKGYVTEAAREVLRFAFMEADLPEVVSFTALGNARSISVMERIGLQREPDGFELQLLPEGHPHREQCFYSLSKEQWLAQNK